MYRFFIFSFLIISNFFLVAQIKNVVTNNGYNILYYPNGQISSEGYIIKGKPDGIWKSYYVNGILKSEGLRRGGELDSVWVFYNENGLIKNQINYLNGKKNGYYYSFNYLLKFDSILFSYLYSQEMYLDNVKNGFSDFFYENGIKQMSISYKNGLKDGLTKEYDTFGNLITIIDYRAGREVDRENINRYKDSVKVGTWKEFYKNGKLKSEAYYNNGLLQGLVKQYDFNGELISTFRYDNGILKDTAVIVQNDINIVEEFFDKKNENGDFIKKASGGFLDGKPVGIHRTYDSLGRVNSSKSYDNKGNLIASGIVDEEGDRVGDWVYFFENGTIKSKGTYSKNKRVGLWYYYYLSGATEQIGSFRNAVPSGKWNWYYENGSLKSEENFKSGKEEGEATEYNEEGTVITRGNYIEDLKEGNWYFNFYFHTEEGNYKNDLRDGIWIYKYKNGKIYFEGRFVQGYPDGKQIFYENNGKILEIRNFVFGKKQGNWEFYNNKGELIKIESFENDTLLRIDGVTIETE